MTEIEDYQFRSQAEMPAQSPRDPVGKNLMGIRQFLELKKVDECRRFVTPVTVAVIHVAEGSH